jgi:hypothetical protein
MPSGSEQLIPLALLAMGLGKGSTGSNASAWPGSTPPTGTTSAQEVPRRQTGGHDKTAWAKQRYALLLALISQSGYVPDPAQQQEIALSLLAQWAHETGRGESEFNFNLGGWRARRKDQYFTARDVMTPNSPSYRWTAYPDLETAMRDQIMRLVKTFPKSSKLLLLEPKSSRWVEQLGREGYYTADPSRYARAWAMNRAELKGVVQ